MGFEDKMYAEGYLAVRQLEDGRWIGLMPFLFTTGLVVDLDEYGYAWRACYERYSQAKAAFDTWDGVGNPPGPITAIKGKKDGTVHA